jgi:hypothetical protein
VQEGEVERDERARVPAGGDALVDWAGLLGGCFFGGVGDAHGEGWCGGEGPVGKAGEERPEWGRRHEESGRGAEVYML